MRVSGACDGGGAAVRVRADCSDCDLCSGHNGQQSIPPVGATDGKAVGTGAGSPQGRMPPTPAEFRVNLAVLA